MYVIALCWSLFVSYSSLDATIMRLRLLGLVRVVSSVQLAEVEKHVLCTTIRLNIPGELVHFTLILLERGISIDKHMKYNAWNKMQFISENCFRQALKVIMSTKQ